MCTAVSFRSKNHYFGRNLDLEVAFGERVTVTPRGFWGGYAMIGMSHIRDGYPLYYDATNEKGLSAAALNFPRSAVYPCGAGEDTAPFELISKLLSRCADVEEAREFLEGVRLTDRPFSPDLPLTPLHWLVADERGALVVEPTAEGLTVQDDPVGVLTNEPPFGVQMLWLSHFMGVSHRPPVNELAPEVELPAFSRGMGGIGLPGDLSSPSRFVRAVFARAHLLPGETAEEDVSQFFHLLGAVEQQKGCVRLEDGSYEFTRYSSCCDTRRGIYYYTTYHNRQITALSLREHDLDGKELYSYPLREEPRIFWENGNTVGSE